MDISSVYIGTTREVDLKIYKFTTVIRSLEYKNIKKLIEGRQNLVIISSQIVLKLAIRTSNKYKSTIKYLLQIFNDEF